MFDRGIVFLDTEIVPLSKRTEICMRLSDVRVGDNVLYDRGEDCLCEVVDVTVRGACLLDAATGKRFTVSPALHGILPGVIRPRDAKSEDSAKKMARFRADLIRETRTRKKKMVNPFRR